MDWFKGKPTGNHRFSHCIIMGFSCKFPLNQSIPYYLILSELLHAQDPLLVSFAGHVELLVPGARAERGQGQAKGISPPVGGSEILHQLITMCNYQWIDLREHLPENPIFYVKIDKFSG